MLQSVQFSGFSAVHEVVQPPPLASARALLSPLEVAFMPFVTDETVRLRKVTDWLIPVH